VGRIFEPQGLHGGADPAAGAGYYHHVLGKRRDGGSAGSA